VHDVQGNVPLRRTDANERLPQTKTAWEPATDVGRSSPSKCPPETLADACSRSAPTKASADEHILALVQEHGIGSLYPHPGGGVEVITRAETAATEPDRAT
jgi:hypothetical protein